MENSYSQFYNKLYTENRDGKNIKKHKHPKLSSNYIQKVIETILTKNQDLHQHEELIRSTFGFDTPLISLNNLFSEYKLDETEFNEIIRKFIKSIYYSVYFRINIYRVFLIFAIGFFIIAGINSLFYELNYFSIVTSNIVRYFIPVSIFVVLIPFIIFSKSRVESRTRNILKQYE
ncbi:MAG: hypothetical protein NUK62_05715 [Tenericutes bacterium]|nr:hypothetical protein [Mycoplasmatota bacterium]